MGIVAGCVRGWILIGDRCASSGYAGVMDDGGDLDEHPGNGVVGDYGSMVHEDSAVYDAAYMLMDLGK